SRYSFSSAVPFTYWSPVCLRQTDCRRGSARRRTLRINLDPELLFERERPSMVRILVADDNNQNLVLLERLLTKSGYEVALARNGAEALAIAELRPPDLIITDVLMPVMDGFELCRRWKSDDRFKNIPFVFFTATYTDPKGKRLGLSMGADLYIVKPQ